MRMKKPDLFASGQTVISNRKLVSPPGTSPHVFLQHRSTANFSDRSFIDKKRTYLIAKRIIDISFSSIFILTVFSWLFPVVGVLILLDSKGPVLFVQRRVGKAGKSFPCFKFRTMIVNQVANIKRADLHDSRVTRIGKFLRNYNIDELPQFLNVLLGHMSIVGPRPHMYSDCHEFSRFIKGYKFRTFVLPGITGLAQANGFHGAVTDTEVFEKRFQCDAHYIRNLSFELDFKILHATLLRRGELYFTEMKFS